MPDFSEFLQCPKTVFFCSRGDKQFYVNPHPKSREPFFSASWDVLSKKRSWRIAILFCGAEAVRARWEIKIWFSPRKFQRARAPRWNGNTRCQSSERFNLSKETSEVGFREDKFDSDDFGERNFENESLAPYFLFSKIRVKLALNLEPLKAAILIRSLSSGNPIKVKST